MLQSEQELDSLMPNHVFYTVGVCRVCVCPLEAGAIVLAWEDIASQCKDTCVCVCVCVNIQYVANSMDFSFRLTLMLTPTCSSMTQICEVMSLWIKVSAK